MPLVIGITDNSCAASAALRYTARDGANPPPPPLPRGRRSEIWTVSNSVEKPNENSASGFKRGTVNDSNDTRRVSRESA